MSDRPEIAACPDAETFRAWYYLKNELVDFARANGIQTSGGKFEIADRIAHFLDTGSPPPRKQRAKPTSTFDWKHEQLTDDTVITDSYKNTVNVRNYFRLHIADFAFSIPLMDWMKANTGKTLADAAVEAQRLKDAKRAGVKQPNQPHNQYNAYTRAYFKAVPNGSQDEVRALWAARRKLPGPYIFDISDVDLL